MTRGDVHDPAFQVHDVGIGCPDFFIVDNTQSRLGHFRHHCSDALSSIADAPDLSAAMSMAGFPRKT